jgi:hypothetical protein
MELRKLAKRVSQSEGPLALFMVLGSDAENEDAWNLIVSSRGLDNKSRGAAIKELTRLLRDEVDASHWAQFRRTTVLRTDDPFVRALNEALPPRHTVINLESTTVGGIEIPKAIVLESHKTAA